MTVGLFIDSIRLKKTVVFDDVSFKITPGISAIYGLNRTNARTSGNGNGAGKSAFFSQIGEILYEDPIVGERKDKVTGGTRLLRTVMNGKRVPINNTGNKLDVKCNGKSVGRTKPQARAWLLKNNPLTKEDFDTYVHSDARVPHPLVMGSSTERKKFFTSFFGLDKMDTERKLFLAELNKLSKVKAAYSEVVNEYRTAKEKAIPKEELAELKQQIEALTAELADLNSKNSRLQNIAQLLSFERSAAPQLKVLDTIAPELDADIFTELMTNARKNLAQDRADLKDAQEWEQYKRDTTHYAKAHDGLSARAKSWIEKKGLKATLAHCREAKTQNLELRMQNAELQAQRKRLHSVLAEELPTKVLMPEDDKKELQARLDSLLHQYEHARKFKQGTCETCGQQVKVKDLEQLKQRMVEIKSTLVQIDFATEYQSKRRLHRDAKQELEKLEPKIKQIIEKLSVNDMYVDMLDELKALPARPVKFEGKKLDVDIKQRMVDEDKERIALLEFIEPNLSTAITLRTLTDKQRKAAGMAERLQDKINSIHEKLSKLNARLEVDTLVRQNVSRLRKRLLEMKEQLVNEEPLKLLVEGYSDKAMKRLAIQAISTRLMKQVNKYSRHVFSEDYTFSFNWDKSDLALLVHRKYGKKIITSDVRKLSGAESKLFTIVLVLALLTFVPARKRCNIMILDEPTANMSEENTKAFMDLLPVLNSIIPSIIVITPRSKDIYPGATNWTMVKINGVAQLLPGHPDDHKKKVH